MQATPHQNEAFDIGTMEISLGVEARLRLKIKGSFETYFLRRQSSLQPQPRTNWPILTSFVPKKLCASDSITFLVTLTYKFVVTMINKENLNCSKLECLISAACYVRRSTMNVWRVNSWRGKWSTNNNSLWLYLSGLMRGQRHDRESYLNVTSHCTCCAIFHLSSLCTFPFVRPLMSGSSLCWGIWVVNVYKQQTIQCRRMNKDAFSRKIQRHNLAL